MKFPFLSSFRPKPTAATYPTGGLESATRYTPDRSAIVQSLVFDEVPNFAREEVLSLARYLVNNFAVMERILTLCESYAVNSGIMAQAATTDKAYNDTATTYFDKWASSPFCSVTQETNLYDMQKLAVRELLIAGEIFFVLTKSAEGYPQVIPVTSEQVRHSGKRTDKSVDGIFYDKQGKALSYQIYFAEKTPSIVEAANVIHLKRLKNVNQKRGISAFAASLNSVRDVKDLLNLEKRSIKVHSALAATVSKRNGDGADGLFNRNRPVTAATGSTASRNPLLEKVFGGAIAYLGENEKVDLIQSNRSTAGFLATVELLLRDVCLNLSLPYELVVDATKLSSAATRFVIQDADFLFSNLQNTLENGWLHRLYAWVIASAVKDKRIPASTDAEWFNVTFVRPQSATIDAGRKDAAELLFVKSGLQSRDAFHSARGETFTKVAEQIAQEKAFLKELEAKYGVKLTDEDLTGGTP